ncbi:MAG: alkaline phosphatase family protein [Pirellulaceae bacterium]|nr:MAG: alkaline phosphatase family protein [Pirellulaceae bacterium]
MTEQNASRPAVVLLSIPALAPTDVDRMPHLQRVTSGGCCVPLVPSFPAVTWPVHAAMVTGLGPKDHGVVGNGFFWRAEGRVEMWTAGNEVIAVPQVWDRLRQAAQLRSAVWFPMLAKRSSADFVCMPAPIHNPDGTESLWCYTKPPEYYRELLERLGHFPLQHFWGPLANIKSTAWIVDSAVMAAERFRPDFFLIYLPHLDYAAQRTGPQSPEAATAVAELDQQIGRLAEGFQAAYGGRPITWLVAGEYRIVPVDHVLYPNRLLREAGYLVVRESEQGELLDVGASQAWAMVDHQYSHVFVRDQDPAVARRVAQLFSGEPGVAEVLVGPERAKYGLDCDRAGDVIVISSPNSWQAYYWWLEDEKAPAFARTVDIHAKPGYDPVELHFDPVRRAIPIDATLVRGSHGAPATDPSQWTVFLASEASLAPQPTPMSDRGVFGAVLAACGIKEAD